MGDTPGSTGGRRGSSTLGVSGRTFGTSTPNPSVSGRDVGGTERSGRSSLSSRNSSATDCDYTRCTELRSSLLNRDGSSCFDTHDPNSFFGPDDGIP